LEHKRVFDPFYTIPGSGETGSGLGLSIVGAIVDRIGADVSLGYASETNHTELTVRVAVPRQA
jgi:two-component system OmpR family sensor kinase